MSDPEVQLAALKAWAPTAADGLTHAFLSELSKPIAVTSTEVDILAHDVLVAALPEEGLGTYCQVKLGALDMPIACIFERDAALAIVAARRDEVDGLAARRADKRALDEDERLSLALVGTTIAEAFQSLVVRLFPKATVASMGAGVIFEGNWGDATPMFTMDVGRAELVLKWGGGDSASARILVAAPLLDEAVATPAPAAPKAARDEVVDIRAARQGAVLALAADPALVEKIKESVAPLAVTATADVTDFLRQWKTGASVGAVAIVPAGEEGIVPLLGGMHQLPDVQARPFFIVLEKPTIEAVVLCGRAQLYDVLPADFTPATLKERWHID